MLSPFWGPKHSKFKAPIEYGVVKKGAILAFKVEDRAGTYWLTPVWISRDMDRAEPPVIAGGVIFAYGSGEDTDQARFDIGLAYNRAEYRIEGSTKAVLYALDAQTGKELWNSGDNLFTIDTDLGRMEWEKHLNAAPGAQASAQSGSSPVPGV